MLYQKARKQGQGLGLFGLPESSGRLFFDLFLTLLGVRARRARDDSVACALGGFSSSPEAKKAEKQSAKWPMAPGRKMARQMAGYWE